MNSPAPVPETETNNADGTPSLPFADPDCPFCAIITNYPSISPLSATSPPSEQQLDPHKLDPPAYVILSTQHVVAFFDVYPLTRGHVLVCPRRHAEKVGDMTSRESGEIGRLLPLLSRAVISACMPDIPHAEADYNVVQNNGPGAAQVIPHAHFHVIPRYPFDYSPPKSTLHQASEKMARRKSGGDWKTPRGVPEGMEATKILFGRGQRHYRDDEDAEELVKVMRERVRAEWEREFGKVDELRVANADVNVIKEKEREFSLRGGGGGKL